MKETQTLTDATSSGSCLERRLRERTVTETQMTKGNASVKEESDTIVCLRRRVSGN